MRVSSGIFNLTVQKCKTFFQVQRGGYTGEVRAEPDQRKSDFWLDPHNYSLRTPQADHLRNVAQCARGKRVHHIERGNIDDHAPRSELAHLLNDAIPQLYQVRITERGLDRGDEILALLENRYLHALPPYDLEELSFNCTTLYPKARSASSMPP
jgi:hypothetical protein